MIRMILPAVLLTTMTALSGAYTLSEAVGTALEERGDVIAARMSAESAEWDSRSADLWFLPSLSGQLAFQKYHDIQEMEVPGLGSIPMGSEYTSQAGLSLSLPVFVPQGPAGARLASRSLEMSELGVVGAEMDAVYQVVQAFYGVLLAEEMVEVSTEALETAEEGYELASLRYDAGTISRFELLQSRVAWENRGPELISAEASLANARASLCVAMGLDESTAAELVVEGTLDRRPALPVPESLEGAFGLMERNSPDLERAEVMRELGDAGVCMARASFMPSLVVSTSYGFQAESDDARFSTGDYERSWVSSLSLQVPIFSGLGDVADYGSSRAEKTSSYASARSLEQASELALVEAWNDLVSAREQVTATEATVAQAEEAASIAMVSYEAGTITRLEMDQAFLALTGARTNHASALFSLRAAEASLMRAMGTMEGYTR